MPGTNVSLETQIHEQYTFLLHTAGRFAEGSDFAATLTETLQDFLPLLNARTVRFIQPFPDSVCAAGDAASAVLDAAVFQAVVADGSYTGLADVLHPGGTAQSAAYVMALPVDMSDQGTGVIWVGRDTPPNDLDGDFLHLFAMVVSGAINQIHRRRLEAEQVWWQTIFASLPEPVMALDARLCIHAINPAAEALFEVDAASIVGQEIHKVMQPPELVQTLLDERGQPGHHVDVQVGERNFRVRLRPLVGDSPVLQGAYLLHLNDISHFKRINENMKMFLQTVSHDLRSPLTAAKGFVDMLPMFGDLNERQSGMKEKILNNITDMTNLVEKVLDAGRLDPEMGAYELRREPCDPYQIISKVVSNLLPLATRRNLTLRKESAPDVPMMNLDTMMLERSLMNLVENAVKYTPAGGDILVSAYVRDDALVLSVKDNGLGIPADKQEILFQRGSRIRREEHKAIRGSGLGLYIVKNVAQQHGGEAMVISAEGEGSDFQIVIPIDGPNLIGGQD